VRVPMEAVLRVFVRDMRARGSACLCGIALFVCLRDTASVTRPLVLEGCSYKNVTGAMLSRCL
jgi:hypothetical protein